MNSFTYRSESEADTERFGRALAGALDDGFTLVALNGQLGAGKTRLVQSVAAALGVARPEVVSPTFVLMHEYHGSRPIYHLDVYRIRDADEFLELGVNELFQPPNLVFVEWAERMAEWLPREQIAISFQIVSPTARDLTIEGHGSRAVKIVSEVRRTLVGDRCNS